MSVSKMVAAAHALVADKKGVTAVEYGVIAALIIAICIAIIGVLGGQVQAAFTAVSNGLAAAL